MSVIAQDMKWAPPAYDLPDSPGIVSFNWISHFDTCIIESGYRLVFDKWSGNDVLTAFTPSSTPVKITDHTLEGRESWDYDYAFFIKERITATEATGVRQTDYTITPGTPEISVGTAPATGVEVSMLYLAADA